MITWPTSLVREVATRRCIFFLGAGVSASSITTGGSRPKDWRAFIEAAISLLHDSSQKEIVSKFVEKENYLLALQAVVKYVDQADYQNFLNAHFNDPNVSPSELHETIYKLDARLVITTNFDNIYDRHCALKSQEGYKVINYHSESLVDEIRSDTRLIIKAHGSINDVRKMIFTKSQYHRAKAEHPHFYDVLKALFITNTVMFIGCGLNDPDVCLLLEDVKITGSAMKPHYVLIKEGDRNQVFIDDWRDSYNINTLQYGPDHSNLVEDLKSLLVQVESERL